MPGKQKNRTDTSEAMLSSAYALHRVGTLGKATMKDFDASSIATVSSIKPEQIKMLRERNRVSQPVFARYLNTSESTVEKWETGAKRPSGTALKLLKIVEKHGLQVLA